MEQDIVFRCVSRVMTQQQRRHSRSKKKTRMTNLIN